MKTFDGYKKQALTDVYALLAGGGHKPLSDFSMAHTHPYLPLSGGTLSGGIVFKYGGNTTDQLIQFSSTDSSDPQTVYLGIRRPLSYGLSYKDNNGNWYSILHSGNYTAYTVKKDGTGASGTWGINITGNAATASKLGTSTIGATNIPIYLNGGTPTAVDLNSTANNLINNLPIGNTIPFDKDYYIAQYTNGGTTKILYYRKPHFLLYNYIKNKAEGTWNISISGNADTIDNKHASDFVPRYIGTGSVVFTQTYFYNWNGALITTPFTWSNPNTSTMFAFTIRIYENYTYTDIVISGYCYGANHWHAPKCRVIGGDTAYNVKFGWFDTADAAGAKHLYVWFGKGKRTNNNIIKFGYGGFSIMNVHAGHSKIDVYSGWSVSNTSLDELVNIQSEQIPDFGKADNAVKLITARTLTIGNTGKSFDGSSNVSWSLSEIGAASFGHTHTTSIATSTDTNQITLVYGGKYKLTTGGTSYVFTMPTSDNTWRPIGTGATDAAAGNHIHKNLIIKWGAGDTEGTNLFTYNGGTAKTINLSTPFSLLFTNFSNADTGFKATNITATISGVTKSFAINWTAYAGRAQTADKWTTARTLTIGNTGKSVDGSANVSWSLAEIGVSAAAHTHSIKINGSTKTIAASGGAAVDLGSYLSLSGGNVSGIVSIRKDLSGNLNDWILKLHMGPLEVGRASNTMCVAIGVTDDNYGYIQTKGSGITTPGNLVLLPGGGNLYKGNINNVIWHAGNDGANSGLDADLLDGIHANGLFTAFSNAGNLTTSISIGGITKTLKIDADTVDGYHADSFYRYRGSYGKSYTDESTEYNLSTGTYVTSEKGHTGTLLSFSSSSSASALQFWTHYNQGNLYYRTSINNNKWSKTNGAWTRILDSDNYNTYTVKKDGTGATGTWGINITGNANTATSSTSSSYTRNLLGRTISGSDYPATDGNLVFSEWNTYSDNRWYLKAKGYETRVGYANNSDYAISAPAAANWGGTGNTTKIKVKINSTTSWMLSFVVTLYQSYKSTKIMISGYNYGNNYWHEPEAVLLGDSNGSTSINVYFGYDSTWNLWVGFDGGNYTGVSITDVTNGHIQISSLKGLFTISNVSSLSTLQKTVTATNSVNYANSAGSVAWNNVSSKPTTLLGYSITDGLYSTQVSAAQDNITWVKGIAKTHRRAFYYNTNGNEYSYLFGFSSSNTSSGDVNYGAVLKMGYVDSYLRILRVQGGNWKTTDWEKISAGYADSSGNADTTDGLHLYTRNLGINGTSWTFASTANANATTHIYAATSAGTSGQILKSTGGTPTWINQSDLSAGYAAYLNVQYCCDNSSPSNKGLWNTIKNGTTNAITNRVRFYTIYGTTTALGAPTDGYGELLEICSYNTNHWQPLLWFGSGKGGRLYYRNKNYNDNTWGSWRTVAWTSDIPTSLPANGGNADTVDGQHFSYSNSSNSPTYLWATNSNGSSFLAARGSISVNYANSAGNADTVDGLHASAFATSGHNHNSSYVSSLTTSGNSLRWVKNGSNNDIIIPYATNAANITGGPIKTLADPGVSLLIKSYGLRSDYTSAGYPTEEYLKAWCKYAYANCSGKVAIGYVNPNSRGFIFADIYASGIDNSSGLPTHITGRYYPHGGNGIKFGTSYGTWYYGDTNTNTWRGIQDNLTSTSTTDSLSANQGRLLANGSARDNTKLPLSGGTLTGTLTMKTNGSGSYNQGIRINRVNTSSWALLLIGKSGDATSGTGTATAGDGAWLIGTPSSSNSLIFNLNDASESKGLCLKGHGANDIKWNNNTVYHAGNLPTYPTKASWNYDDRYVASVSISGNNLRINKNGANTDLTIPYATNAGYATKATNDSDNNAINTTYLKRSGGTMTGVIKSTFSSGSWINGVTNAIIKGEYTSYGAILSMPVKDGRVSLSSYPDNNNNIYFGYATAALINAGTNSFNKLMYWDAVNNNLYADVFTGSLSGNASSATKLTTSAGNTTLPIYFSDGKPVACTSSSIFSNLSNSGNNLSITVAGYNRTLTVNYANSADKSNYLTSKYVGNSGDTVAQVKLKILDSYTSLKNKLGYSILVNSQFIARYSEDNYVIPDNGIYSLTYLTPGYDGKSYGQWLAACLGSERLYVFGRSSNLWTERKTIAWTTDIPTSLKNPNTLTLQAGTFIAKTYDGSTAVTVNIPTHTSHLVNNSGFLTSHLSLANYVTLNTAQTITGAKTFSNNLTLNTSNENRYITFNYTGGTGYDWRIGYLRSGDGDANYFVILSDKTDGTYVNALRIGLTTLASVFEGTVKASKFITNGGESTQFVKGDGSLDSNTYATTVLLSLYLPLAGGTLIGSIILKGGTSADMTYAGNIHPYIRFDNSDSSLNISLIFTEFDTYRAPAGIKLVGNQGNEWFEATNIYATTFYGALSGNASTATKLTSSAGNTTLPVYFSDGKPVACNKASIFSNLSNNGNDISITIAGLNRILTVGYASEANWASEAYSAEYANLAENATTASKWTIARTLTIGNTGKAVDGSTNVSWTLAEIGAATSGHTHTLTLASDTGANPVALVHGGKYKLTAGGSSIIFTLPADNNTAHTKFTWTNGSTVGPAGSLSGNHTTVAFPAIPSATASISGIVTTGTLSFAGNKTFNGHITLGNSSYLIKRVGCNVSWVNGRDSAIVRQTSASGYSTVVSSKTVNGSWEIGNYTNNGDSLYFTHIADSNYNSGNNDVSGQVYFNSSGSIYANNLNASNNVKASGNVNATGSMYATHFYENSDIRYKKILRNLSINSNTIANLPLFDFEWIENNAIGTGTSALAVQQILPNLVSGTDKLTLDYGVLGTIAGITACKELVMLKSELLQLKEKVKLLEDKLRKYENI